MRRTVLAALMAAPLFCAASAAAYTCPNGNAICGATSDDTHINGFVVDSSESLVFKSGTGAVEQLRITATGSVGIGTAAPRVALDLASETDALLLPTGTTGQRPSPVAGMIRYNTTTPAIEGYVSGVWSSLGGSGGGTLGATATAASPSRSGDVGTGLFSNTASTVQITTAGSERMRVTATGSLGVGATAPSGFLDVQGGTASASTAGGGINLIAQTASGTNLAGGAITVTGGASTGSGAAGAVSVTGGLANSATGGAVTIAGGGSTSGAAGSVTLRGGTPTAGAGGSATVQGAAGVGTNKAGGNIYLNPGAATGTGVAGAVILGSTGTGKASVDFSGKTDALILQTASAAASASCTTTLKGGIRYNSNLNYIEYCNGTAWSAFVATQTTTPPTAPSGSGYFVLTNTTYDGNLGGLSGADAKCLTELTTNTSWAGYSTANSNNQLNSTKVKAWLCNQNSSNGAIPLATYTYAAVNYPGNGGATFTTDSNGYGPNDSISWASANRFGITVTYWWGGSSSSTQWQGPTGGSGENCISWTFNGTGYSNNLIYGNSGDTSGGRFLQPRPSGVDCNSTLHLICLVNP